MEKKTDSTIIGAGVGAILFIGTGISKVVVKDNGYWVYLILGSILFTYLIYLLKRTKDNLHERYEDERKNYIREKSSSISYHLLFGGIIVFRTLIHAKYINISTEDALMMIIASALVIELVVYRICKYKY